MQVMPASFFNLVCAFMLFALIAGMQTLVSFYAYADSDLSLSDNVKRVSLLKTAIRSPQALSLMDADEITILLRHPTVKRDEGNVVAWNYHGDSCALDVYFKKSSQEPDYIEFRALDMNDIVQAQFEKTDTSELKEHCLKDVLESQGVNTRSNVASRPLPSWDSPYRS